MVSKNNRLKHNQWMAKQQPHYGLRKLSFRVASVLLGTTLYFWANDVVAKAATADTNNADSVNQVENNQSAIQQPNSKVVMLNHNQPTHDQNTNSGDDQQTNANVPVAVTPHDDSNENQQDWSLTSDHDTISLSQPTISLTWQVSNFKNGDVWSLNIPSGDLYHNKGVTVDPLPSGIGSTTTTQNRDGSFTITNTFTSNAPAGGMSQGITISREYNSHVVENGRLTKDYYCNAKWSSGW